MRFGFSVNLPTTPPAEQKAAKALVRPGGFSNLTFSLLLSFYPILRESSVGWSIAAVVVSPLSA
jgi:hypothetical protein